MVSALKKHQSSGVGGYSPRLNKRWALLYIMTLLHTGEKREARAQSLPSRSSHWSETRGNRSCEGHLESYFKLSHLELFGGEQAWRGRITRGPAAGASASSSVRHFLVTSGRPLRFFLGFKRDEVLCFKSLVVARGTWEERPVVRVRFWTGCELLPRTAGVNGGWGVWTLVDRPHSRAPLPVRLTSLELSSWPHSQLPSFSGIYSSAGDLHRCLIEVTRWVPLKSGRAGQAVLSTLLPWLICWENLVGRKVFKFPHRQGNAVNTSMSFHSSLLPTASRTSFRPGDWISATGLNAGVQIVHRFFCFSWRIE